jgi:hypothetical protein
MINAGGRNETNSPLSVKVLKAGGRKASAVPNYTLRIYLFNGSYSTYTPPAYDMPGSISDARCTPAWTTAPIVGVYPSGSVVAIRAYDNVPISPDPWTFDSFTGDLTGTTNPQNITMDSDKTVIAIFYGPMM